MKNIINIYQEHKQCAYKNCTNTGSKKLHILYIHKEGWFCEECAQELILHELVEEVNN